jgi:hypothetical protein
MDLTPKSRLIRQLEEQLAKLRPTTPAKDGKEEDLLELGIPGSPADAESGSALGGAAAADRGDVLGTDNSAEGAAGVDRCANLGTDNSVVEDDVGKAGAEAGARAKDQPSALAAEDDVAKAGAEAGARAMEHQPQAPVAVDDMEKAGAEARAKEDQPIALAVEDDGQKADVEMRDCSLAQLYGRLVLCRAPAVVRTSREERPRTNCPRDERAASTKHEECPRTQRPREELVASASESKTKKSSLPKFGAGGLYMKGVRAALQQEGKTFSQAAKLASESWRAATEDVRCKYIEEYRMLKSEHQAKISREKNEGPARLPIYGPGEIFMREERKRLYACGEISAGREGFAKAARLASQTWKKFDPEKRAHYIGLYNHLKKNASQKVITMEI